MSKKSNHRINKKELLNRLLCLFEQSQGRTLNIKDIFRTIGVQTHPAKMLTIEVLEDLVFDDYLTSDQQGNYCHQPRSIQVIEGTFHKQRNGHNVFCPDDGGKEILVGERNSLHALDGDRVKVTMLARRRGHVREAEVIEIVERAKDTFVGKIQVERDYAFVLTDRSLATDIFVPRANIKGAKNGEKVLVKIVDWPEQSKCPTGKVVDILGAEGDNDTEMHAILAEYGLPYSYPSKVEKAAEKIQPGISAEEIARREDFRDVTTFTIDPHDAKDFDDALSLRILATPPTSRTGGADSTTSTKVSADGQTVPPVRGARGVLYEVGVHIADVSHYVEEGSIIDREALDRATSVYLVDRTIPMLPEHLCNFVCSLRPDEEKLTYSVIFKMNEKGEVKDWHLAHTVIRSNRRFTYEEVQQVLEDHHEASPEDYNSPGDHYAPLNPDAEPAENFAQDLITLNRMAKELRRRRFAGGAVDFDRCEPRFEIDAQGKPLSVYFKVAKDDTKPFYVETYNQQIRVLGTEFNINSYLEDNTVKTTLVTGRIAMQQMGDDSREMILTPGHQAIFDKGEQSMQVKSVDTEVVTSWKDGMFVFEEQNLASIMQTLSRWYDFTYEFRDHKAASTIFMGRIPRYADFQDVIRIIEASGGLTLRLDHKKLTIASK